MVGTFLERAAAIAASPVPAPSTVAPSALVVRSCGAVASAAAILASMRPFAGPAGYCWRSLRPAFSSSRGRPVGGSLLSLGLPRVHHHLLIDLIQNFLSHCGVGVVQWVDRVPAP